MSYRNLRNQKYSKRPQKVLNFYVERIDVFIHGYGVQIVANE